MPATWSHRQKANALIVTKRSNYHPVGLPVHHSGTGVLCSFWGRTCNCPSVAVFHIIGASLSEPNANGNQWVVRLSRNRKSTKKHGNFTIMCTIELYIITCTN